MKNGRPGRDIAPWIKMFESSALYRHDYGRLFDDWLTILVCMFANGKMEEDYLKVIGRYNRKEVDVIVAMTGTFMDLMCTNVPEAGHWYDALGEIYMYLNSRSKSSALGQFFTPPELCDMIAGMMKQEHKPGQVILEPACGSGRMVLAAHALNPCRDLRIAIDLDPMCAKMTAVNFLLHGVKSEVACANTLWPDKWYFAYQTHPYLWNPFIVPVPREKSLTAPRMELIRDQSVAAVVAKANDASVPKKDPPLLVQGSLFE